MERWAIDLLATAPPGENRSGLSRVVWELATALAARGHRPRVLYPSAGPPPSPEVAGVHAVPIPVPGSLRGPYGRERAIARAASALLDPAADLLLANDEKGGAISLPGPRGPRFLMFAHDIQQHHLLTMRALGPNPPSLRQRLGTFRDRRAIRRLEGTAFDRARAILVASEANRNLLREFYPWVPADRIHLLPPSVPTLPDVGDRDAARGGLLLPRDVPVVSFIGHTPDRQGLPLALEAFRRVRAFFPGARFLVVGSSGASAAGVSYLGFVDEATKARVLRASDLFLFPARYEGFGLAPREAMRAGVATIVSRHVPIDGAGRSSVVRVVPEDDAGAYASELAELLADPALRRQLGERGRAYAEQFRPERMAERFEEIVRPVLGRG